MFGIPVLAFLGRPLFKYGLLALAVVGLVIGVVLYIDGVRRDGKKAGAAEVTTAVQGETIKQTEKARQDKEKANEAIRDKPLDAVIDGLR